MRDAHRIREQGPVGAWMGRWLPGTRALAGMAAAFFLGRLTAPPPPAPVAGPPAAFLPAPEPAPPPPPAAAEAPQAAAERREGPRSRLKPARLVASADANALVDGLLPSQLGSASRGEFSVQVAAFEERAEARAFCQQLTRRGFHPHLGNKRNHPRPHGVRLGRFGRRQEAERYRTLLGQADISSAVVQVD